MTKKKPTTKKPKPPTLKDLATRLGANLRRMDEMGRQITALYTKTNGLHERTDRQSRDIGELVHWKNAAHGKGDAPNIEAVMKRIATMDNRIGTVESGMASIWKRADGVDKVLSANAATHQKAGVNLSTALDLLDSGQRIHAGMISELGRKVEQVAAWAKGSDHSGTLSALTNAPSPDTKGEAGLTAAPQERLIYRARKYSGGHIYLLANSIFDAEKKLEHSEPYARSSIEAVSGLVDLIIL